MKTLVSVIDLHESVEIVYLVPIAFLWSKDNVASREYCVE